MASEVKESIISVHDLWKSYGKLQVLKELNLEVYKGETLVILGRSGVGKSVLLRQIIGIEKPDKGEIAINGAVLSKIKQRDRTKVLMGVGMLFQGSALFDSMTVGDNVAFYLRQHPDLRSGKVLTEKEIQERVEEALSLVDMAKTEAKMPSDLSGGMRKRAALARLIAYKPYILLFDEPTTGLDPVTAMQINLLIQKTQEKLGSTSIVVTHDIRSAMEVGNRLALHNDGKITHIAPKEEFVKIDDPILHSFFDNALVKI